MLRPRAYFFLSSLLISGCTCTRTHVYAWVGGSTGRRGVEGEAARQLLGSCRAGYPQVSRCFVSNSLLRLICCISRCWTCGAASCNTDYADSKQDWSRYQRRRLSRMPTSSVQLLAFKQQARNEITQVMPWCLHSKGSDSSPS